MFKKVKAGLAVALLGMSSMASAQFMGLDSVALSDDTSHIMLKNAAQALDSVMLDKWRKEKGSFYIPYDNKNVCYVGFSSFNSNIAHTFKFVDDAKHMRNGSLVNPIIYGTVYPIMTACDKLPLLEVAVGDGAKIRDRAKVNEYTKQMVEDLGPEQWEQLIFVIINHNLPYAIKKAALDKFVEFYPQRLKYQSRPQEFFYKQVDNFKSGTGGREALVMMSAKDPVMFMFNKILDGTIGTMQEVSKSKAYKNLDSYSKDFWHKKKTPSPEDFTGLKGISTGALATVYRKSMILRDIMHLPDFKINYQDMKGNTYLHTAFSDIVLIRDMGGNKIFADLMRATLDKGLNPMLLNHNSETAFLLFEKNVTAKKSPEVFNAFMLKEYPN